MRFRALSRSYTWLGRSKGLLTVASATVGASLKADPIVWGNRFGVPVRSALTVLQERAWILLPAMLLLIPVLEGARRVIGDPRIWGIVHDVLDQYRERLFEHADEDQVHEHRVTLFKRVRWRWCMQKWPWSGWLVPVERSGHTSQKSHAAFLAPDEADHAQGVAGMTWSRNRVVYVKDLPDLSAAASEADFEEYARSTWMPLEHARGRRPRARSMFGIPVEVGNELWGVVVVDSRHPAILEPEAKRYYSIIARFLGKTLEDL